MKEYSPHQDIVYLDEGYERMLDKDSKYNILVGADSEYMADKTTNYVFGHKVLDNKMTSPHFKIDLLMSDVF